MSEPLRSLAHTRAHACMPTALCRDGTRRVSSACAICKLLLREYAYAMGGGVIAVRFCPARTRTHTRAHACMPTALCRDGTRGVSSACAICKLLLREYAYARGGGGLPSDSAARALTHARTLARQPTSPLAYLGVSRGYRASERRVGTAKSPSIQCISASAYRPNCLSR